MNIVSNKKSIKVEKQPCLMFNYNIRQGLQ